MLPAQILLIGRIIITGGLGQYIDIEKAARIGLLTDIDCNKHTYLGNSSIVAVYMGLLSNQYRREAIKI